MSDTATLARPTADDARERLRLWLDLLRTTRAVEAELRARMRATFGVSLGRFDAMAALHRAAPRPLRMGELAGALMVSGGNATALVDRLEADGSVRREPVPGDRRAATVALTEAGAAEFERMAAVHARWVDELFGGLDAGEIAAARRALASVVDGLRD